MSYTRYDATPIFSSELVSDVLRFILARTCVALFSWQAICSNHATHVNRSLGAEAVLGTLWQANPDTIVELLTSMADYHKEGDTHVQVLTKAQRELIEDDVFKSPWFWVPYQLHWNVAPAPHGLATSAVNEIDLLPPRRMPEPVLVSGLAKEWCARRGQIEYDNWR